MTTSSAPELVPVPIRVLLPGDLEVVAHLWSRRGAPLLAAVCCANPVLFREYLDLLFLYTQDRISRVGQAV